MNISIKLLVVILIFCHSITLVYTQEAPKVGLVFSGGGAKGAAYIGALKVIEESGIKFDYISGASIGSIIGGLYATGWSVEQMEDLILNYNLAEIMRDKRLRSTTPLFEKEYGEDHVISLSLKDGGIVLPSALSSGQDLFNFLTHLTDHVEDEQDFSKFKIPFLAVGTDIATGKEYVIEEGSLAAAMRASGSFPGLLSPFLWNDGTLLVDGGIVNNFPAKLLRDKGMDIVIGLNVGAELSKKEELVDFASIMMQLSSYQTANSVTSQIPYCDFVISPDIEGFSVTSFEAVDVLLKNGEEEALKYKPLLDSIAALQGNIGVPNTTTVNDIDSVFVDEVDFLNESNIDKYARQIFKNNFPYGLEGWMKKSEFIEQVEYMVGDPGIQYIYYSFIKKGSGNYKLEINPVPSVEYDSKFKIGIRYDNVNKASLLFRLEKPKLFSETDILSLNGTVGVQNGYRLNYLMEIPGFPDVGVNSALERNKYPINFPINNQDSLLSSIDINFNYNDWSNEIYLRLIKTKSASIGIGTEYKYLSSRADALRQSSGASFVGEEGKYFTTYGYWNIDSRDKRYFASNGFYSRLRLRFVSPLASSLMNTLDESLNVDLNFSKHLSISNKVSLVAAGDVGIVFGATAPAFLYQVGGIEPTFLNNYRPFEGYKFSEAFGANFLKGSVHIQYNIAGIHYLTLGGNIGFLSNYRDDLFTEQKLRSTSIAYGMSSPLGPVNVVYAISNDGNEFHINIGKWF